MKSLPVYTHVQVPDAAPLPHDNRCERCDRGSAVPAGKRCILPEMDTGAPGDDRILYVLADAPTGGEATVGRPFSTFATKELRKTLRAAWSGHIVYDYALRCPGGAEKAKKSGGKTRAPATDACLPYTLSGILMARDAGKLDRVLCLGENGVLQMLGHTASIRSTFNGYGYRPDGLPVFWAMNPSEFPASLNAWYMRKVHDHARWACSVPRENLFPPRFGAKYNLVQTPEDAAAMRAWSRTRKWLSYDTETAGSSMHAADFGISSIAFGADDGTSYVVDATELYGVPDIRRAVTDILTDYKIGKGGQNIKYDNKAVFFALGIEVQGPQYDVRLARKLQDAEVATDLDTMAALVGMGGHKADAVKEIETFIRQSRSNVKRLAKASGIDPTTYAERVVRSNKLVMPLAPLDVLEAAVSLTDGSKDAKGFAYSGLSLRTKHAYNARDSVSTDMLRAYFMQKCETGGERGLREAWVHKNILMPASMAYERIEARGFLVHQDNVKTFNAYLDTQQKLVAADLRRYVPQGFNPDSDKQRSKFLFEDLGLPVLKVSAITEEASSADAVLEALEDRHPVVPLLRKWSKLSTMRERYGDGYKLLDDGTVKHGGMVGHICSACGRVHATYNLDVARTGRTSCSGPALQGWTSPSRDEDGEPSYGKWCRDEFTAPPGWYILQADYKQLEYFVAAMLFDDPLMQKFCAMKVDPHMEAAKLVAHLFGIAPALWDALPKEEKKRIRSYAKTIVFAQLYGQGLHGLAKRLKCDVATARKIATALFGNFKVLMENIAKARGRARRDGFVYSVWNGLPCRYRPVDQLGFMGSDKYSEATRAEGDRIVVNTPVQGTAAEYCTASVVALEFGLPEAGFQARVVASVHDSVVLEVPEHELDAVASYVREIMCGWPSYSPSGVHVQLDVDIEYGQTWGTLKPWVPQVAA